VQDFFYKIFFGVGF